VTVSARGARTSQTHGTAISDAEGVALLEGLPALELALGCRVPESGLPEGWYWRDTSVDTVLPAGQELTVSLVAVSGVSLRIVDESGRPVPGIEVELTTSTGKSARLRMHEEGVVGCSLEEGEVASFSVDATVSGGARYRGRIDGVAAGTREATLVVRKD
jgi:hypothetical protein